MLVDADQEPDTSSPAPPTVVVQLQWLAKALFAAYFFSVAAEALPLKIGDANWRLNLVDTVVDNATIPLIGLGIAHLAFYLDPDFPPALALWRRVSRLAVLASLGFALIIPVQIGTSVSLYVDLSASRFREINKTDQRLQTLASAVQASATVDQLESTLLTLQGSALNDNDRDQPLTTLKRVLLDRIREARKVLQARRRQLKAAAPLDPTLLVRRSLRLVLTSLVFSLAFAAGAQLPNSPFSLLEDWQISGLRLEEWWVRSRTRRREQQAERRAQRQEQQRIAALEALRQDEPPEPWEPQETELAPWFPSPPRSDLEYFNRLVPEDPANGATADPQAELLDQERVEERLRRGPPGRRWWLRSREMLRAWQAEWRERRLERQRIAAREALRQWWTYGPLEQQEGDAEPWGPAPDWRHDLADVANIRSADQSNAPTADPEVSGPTAAPQVDVPRRETASDSDLLPPSPPQS